MALLYLLYFLRDRVHYSQLFPGHKAEDGLVILILDLHGRGRRSPRWPAA